MMPKPAPTQLIQVEKPIYGGAFLARVEGKAVFVPLALPGERALVRITEDKRGYATAEIDEIVQAAPERTAPACKHFGTCGGCHYQHTDYETQLRFKQAILRETLERGGVIAPAKVAVLAATAQPWGYRNRIRLAFDAAGNPGYRGRRSHAVVAIKECPIAAPLLVETALAAAEVARKTSLRLTEIALFCNADETAMLVSVSTASAKKIRFDQFAEALHERVPALTGAELLLVNEKNPQPRTIAEWGASSICYRAAGFDYRVDRGAFFQVNRWLVEALVERVTAGLSIRQLNSDALSHPFPQKSAEMDGAPSQYLLAGSISGALAWDLYAGVGLFARRLTASFKRVVAVESAPASTKALAANLKGTGGVPVRAATLEFLRRDHKGERPDLIVLDPPRTGLVAECCALLAELAAPSLVCVSCDPATLARDLKALIESGYRIESIALADLFPQTFHLETVVHLRRA